MIAKTRTAAKESPCQSLNSPPFYLTSEEYNKAFAPSSSLTRHYGHTLCDQRTPSTLLNKMAVSTGFPASAAKTGKPTQERIKENDRDVQLARTQTSAVFEHVHETNHHKIWNEVKFIDRDPHCFTRRVKKTIHTD